jgi:hypothetical protein
MASGRFQQRSHTYGMQERLLQLHPVADVAHKPMQGHHIVRHSQPHLQITNKDFGGVCVQGTPPSHMAQNLCS